MLKKYQKLWLKNVTINEIGIFFINAISNKCVWISFQYNMSAHKGNKKKTCKSTKSLCKTSSCSSWLALVSYTVKLKKKFFFYIKCKQKTVVDFIIKTLFTQ